MVDRALKSLIVDRTHPVLVRAVLQKNNHTWQTTVLASTNIQQPH